MKLNFRRLMQIYTVVLLVLGLGITGVGIVSSVSSYQSSLEQAENMATQRATETVTRYQTIADDYAANITSDGRRLTNIAQYFALSPAAYAQYAITQSQGEGQYYNWSNESSTFMMQHPEVKRLTLTLNVTKAKAGQVFVATQKKKEGQLLTNQNISPDFSTSLINPTDATIDGTLGIDYDRSTLDQQLAAIDARAHLQVLVLNNSGVLVNHFSDSSVDKNERALATKAAKLDDFSKLHDFTVEKKELPNEFTLIFVVSRSGMRALMFWRVASVALLGLFVLALLSALLWVTFGRYRVQLNTILATVKTVGNGDLKARVPVTVDQSDLSELGDGINRMLGDIDQYIYTIYQLRIAQQEANIKALQAQINPHFMSNTLEYIRMAALDADQPELANVVYNFAALLRNNTDFSPLTTIQHELDFIDKYVFLYQVRFPDRLAYQITVDPTIAALSIPKFSFQPLVENYFVHGVDFSRGDNVIRIKSWREGDLITISIANNGKPLALDEVQTLNKRMKEPLAGDQSTSIGIQNVYSRLADYFGDSFNMFMTSDGLSGVQTTIQFRDPAADKGGHDEKSNDR
ncbi:sensor histidine kinase [Lacticaseibacillus mingshuiensis]|uniref:sensor histidine kinase n=1 Tax=Lacticaseibacillus mingshuiensis TaxID=2799574 RepID=UPI0019409D0A|nr:sensor histidine kinase [Lacticaseibacillus mingshuiensis]